MLKNREEAGKKLAENFSNYRNKGALVLAIPNGGVEAGCIVAERLEAEFSLAISVKLPYPDDPASSFGSVAEDGSTFIHSHAYRWFTEDRIREIVSEQKQEIQRRISVLRRGHPLPRIKNRTVIIIDEGITKGATMQSIINMCRKSHAKRIMVGVAVASREITDMLTRKVDKMVVLEKPLSFRNVSQVYEEWDPVEESEVPDIIDALLKVANDYQESREVA
jgi:predicted phosphoribosyltransferase